jgi:hypothetical protein
MSPVTEPRPPDHPLSLSDIRADDVTDGEAVQLGRAVVQVIAAGGYNMTLDSLPDSEAEEIGRSVMKAIAAGGGN